MKKKIKFILLLILSNLLMCGTAYKVNKKIGNNKKFRLITANSIMAFIIILINCKLKNKFRK